MQLRKDTYLCCTRPRSDLKSLWHTSQECLKGKAFVMRECMNITLKTLEKMTISLPSYVSL